MYVHFQDFIDSYVGPFSTKEDCLEHVKFCELRGDDSAFIGIVSTLPEGEYAINPESDKTGEV